MGATESTSRTNGTNQEEEERKQKSNTQETEPSYAPEGKSQTSGITWSPSRSVVVQLSTLYRGNAYRLSNPENVRSNVLMKLQEALDEEAILEEQMLALMHRFADRFTDRRVEINNLMVLHDHQLIDYGMSCSGDGRKRTVITNTESM
ncbi:hypothetical protein Tco_1384987 [Tanacetum coccineum]